MEFKYLVLLVIASFFCLTSCKHQPTNFVGVNCSFCELEPDAGNCEALIPKYYFDKDEKRCKKFDWGGCDGVVPFETLSDCESCKCN